MKGNAREVVEYQILGPIEALESGRTLDIGSRQQRALLAILVMNANRVVAKERILDDLWRHESHGKERTLWVYVSRLRAVLDPDRQAGGKSSVLATRDHGYILNVDCADIDAHRFEELADRGRDILQEDPDSACRLLRQALALWRGSALEEFAYDDFARADADRLEDRRLAALEDRVDADIRSGRHRDVIGEIEQLAAAHPERERFVAQQMIALYRAGRQADALRAFDRHRRRIGEEFGLEPTPDLRRIQEQVLLHDTHLVPAAAQPREMLDADNPFVGLRSFGEGDADRFFGRERLVDEIIGRIDAGSSLIALVGSSGSGKSSVLHAGLVNAIRDGATDGVEPWLIARMVPGSDPFRELAAALSRAAPDEPHGLDGLLTDSEDGALCACLRLLPGPGWRVLVVIDQFEELFTLGETRTTRDRFIRNLEVALDDPDGRVVIAIGLRADFYGRPLEYPVFAQALADGIVNVVPLTAEELEAAAERPAAHAGAALEPALLVRLLSDVAGQAGGLPLFQYALTELFDQRDGALLTYEAYEAMDGLSGAIARRAEDLFLELTETERDVAKQLFLRLVTIDEQGAWGRRRVAGGEIAAISDELVALEVVLHQFSRLRLVTLGRDPGDDSSTVEVAHEALLDRWPRLRRWIETGRQDVIRNARLSTARTEWEASSRQPGYLLSGQRLTDYEQWATTSTLRPSAPEREFLDASIRRRASEIASEEQRVEREANLEGRARRRRMLLAATATAIAVAVGAGFFLLTSSGEPAIAVVHGAGGDLGVSDLMIAGVGNAERERGARVDLLEPLIDPQEDLRRLADSGIDLVIVSNEFDLAVDSVVADYPDVRWVAVDPAAVHIENSNLTEIHFAVEESAFVAGAAAARSSETRSIAFVGGYQTFRTERSRNGFEQGARWVDPGIDITSMFIGPVIDPVAAAESRDDLALKIATEMYSDGVDVIFHDAGPAGGGIARAANQRSDEGTRVWMIGSDSDEYLTRPEADRDVVLSSTLKRFDIAVEMTIAAFLDEDLAPGETFFDLANDGVGLSRAGGHLATIDGELKNLEGDLAFGHIQVSPHAERPPAWQHEADVFIELTQSDGDCTIDRITVDGAQLGDAEIGSILAIERDDVVLAQLTNASSDVAAIALRPVPIGMTGAELVAEEQAGVVPAASLGVIHAISTAQLGGSTGAAAVVSGEPIAISCILGVPSSTSTAHYPLIVSPS